MLRGLFIASCITISLLGHPADAQELEDLTRAYTPEECSSCEEWDVRQEPFRIYGNSYYVGTHGLSAILITSLEGHVLIDAGLPSSAPLILDNIRAVGFDPGDIELILNSHAHFDHAGGIAAIRSVSGARVMASPASAEVLERGTSGPEDPQFGLLLDYPPVGDVERFTPGDTLRLGDIELASHPTAGHTPGGTSWSWRSCEEDGCMHIVYADSQTPVSADYFLFTSNDTYPSALAAFARGADILERLPCDILITTHPGASSLWVEGGPAGLIDSGACRDYAQRARQAVAERVKRETSK